MKQVGIPAQVARGAYRDLLEEHVAELEQEPTLEPAAASSTWCCIHLRASWRHFFL